MSEEPRRSGRSTKGQHKNLDLVADVPSKKSKAKGQGRDRSSKASAEPTPGPSEDEEIIRCICGQYEEEEDVERDMICCDQCSAWQHNDCMGLSFAKGEEPEHYFCEQCKPQNHKELLERMARGEKPWEEAAERRRQELEEQKASRRKKGKKGGRKSKANEVKAEPRSSQPPMTAASATPTPAPASEHPEGSEGSGRAQKRKLDEHEATINIGGEHKSKQQRVSPQVSPADADAKAHSRPGSLSVDATSRTDAVSKEAKHPARKSASSALIKLFQYQISEARKRGSFTGPAGKTTLEVAEQLGVAIEEAMNRNLCGGSREPTEAYKAQLRTILFNVKKNPSLRDRLLVGDLSPDALSKMSSQDMASEELQQKDAEIKREAERQHIIVQEQGPRIRRTHKGEELIEDQTPTAATESIFSAAPGRRSIVESDGSPMAKSPVSPTVHQRDGRAEPTKALRPRSIDTKNAAGTNRPHVGSPGTSPHDRQFPEVATHIREPLHHGRAQADADIDKLLRDDEPESPPYSPKDYQEDGVIWRGNVVMNSIAEFSSSAKHVGGADLSGRVPWSQLVPPTLVVDGRIDVQLASNYLCGLRFSSSTDVTVIAVASPDSPSERAGFDKLFNYFAERKRYGVVGKHALAAVKDTYVVPIEAGTTTKPEFIELLENNTLESPSRDRLLLIVFAVKTGDSNPPSVQPPSHRPSLEPSIAASPLTGTAPTPQQRSISTPGPGPGSAPQSAPGQPALSPPSPPGMLINPGPNVRRQPVPQPQLPTNQPVGQAHQYPASGAQQMPVTGLAAAIQVLGAQSNTPAVQQLLQQAPNADASQLGVVRDILSQQPEAASNFELLKQALIRTTANGHQQNGS